MVGTEQKRRDVFVTHLQKMGFEYKKSKGAIHICLNCVENSRGSF